MDLANRQAAKAATRDDAMQRLRDLTVAVAIAACGALGVFAWLSANTIPGSASTATQPPSDDSQFANLQPGDDLNQQPAAFAPAPARAGNGSGFVVSGGSH
jgi:hypothetical protein